MTQTAQSYFAAANTDRGFVSFFDGIFFSDNVRRRYIIKGGPGTGKSSLMRRLALCAERAGKNVEYYLCSSDTDSIDGILIDGELAVLDGTAPHSYDTALAGAIDEIINLGELWDSDMLREKREDIRILADKKRAAYDRGYGYLSSAGELRRTMRAVIAPCIKRDKLGAAVGRMLARIDAGGEKGSLCVRQVSALGVKGAARLDTFERICRKRYLVEDHYGTATEYLARLAHDAQMLGEQVEVSYSVPHIDIISDVYFPRIGVLFSSQEKVSNGDSVVNMKRFTDAEALANVRFAYRTAKQAYESIIELAERSLAEAGTAHADAEKIYVGAMDFSRHKKLTDSLCRQLIG